MLKYLSIFVYLFLNASVHTPATAKPPSTNASVQSVVNQVNTLRHSARMSPVTYSALLTQASQHHANYLSRHTSNEPPNVNLHRQRSTLSGFSGEHAWERAKHIGYTSRIVKENISAGNKNSHDSLDGLMSAIYHRFIFLDFLIDTIGYGVATASSAKNSGYSSYVYNMGRKDIEDVCEQRPANAAPKQGLNCLGTTVNANYMKKACSAIPQEAIYQAPYPMRCRNGTLLQNDYIENLCITRPLEIQFQGNGSYIEICKPKMKISTEWFKRTCASNDPHITHDGDTRYYEICENKTRVSSSWYKNFCQSASAADKNMNTSSYSTVCNSGFKVNKQHLDQLDQQHFKRNPDFVIWPAAGAREVTPVFFEEDPDPLPDLSVSGYPLSLHFNPGKVETVSIKDFKLEKVLNSKTRQRIKNIRELNHNTDPQKHFTKLQFAWFPLQRLDWDSYYRASATATINGRQRVINWAFKTKSLSNPLIKITPQQTTVKVPDGKWFTLYIPPSKSNPHPLKKVNLKWQGSAKVDSEIIDSNTVKIRLNNTGCRTINLALSQGRKLKLNPCIYYLNP